MPAAVTAVPTPSRASDLIHVAPGLALDADEVAGSSIALLGQRGSGKTHACRVLVEELLAAAVTTVVLDPMGAFWGLRSSADGHHEGLPIPVFGGDHGDAPLEPSAGALMADLVVDEGLSMVLDMSGFGSRTQERTFAAAFLDRLYRRNRDLAHLVVDEADLLAPQKPRREDARLLVTMENIVRRGRNRGIGCTMASQRPAVLSKDVLSQVGMLVAMKMTAPQDRDAIREWVRGQGDENSWSQIAPSLPGLKPGESWWWLPAQGLLERVQVRPTRTFDSSATRTRSHGARTPRTFADVDLAAITSRMAATVERARDNDPRELRRRIADLEARQASATDPRPDPALTQRLTDAAAQVADALAQSTRNRTALVEEVLDALTRAVAALGVSEAEEKAHEVGGSLEAAQTPSALSSRPAPPRRPGPEPGAVAEAGQVSPARLNLLNALAALAGIGVDPVDRNQLALWAGVSPKSSGYANNLGALRTAGLIDYPSGGTVALADRGRELSTEPVRAWTVADLHAHVQRLLSPARWRLVQPLVEVYPQPLTKTDLAERAGVSPASSGYANNLGALRSLGLVDYPAPGMVAATDVLFLR